MQLAAKIAPTEMESPQSRFFIGRGLEMNGGTTVT